MVEGWRIEKLLQKISGHSLSGTDLSSLASSRPRETFAQAELKKFPSKGQEKIRVHIHVAVERFV